MESKVYDVIVVGAGPAGITAANLLAGKGLETLLVDRSAQQMLHLPETFNGISRELLAQLDIERDIQIAIGAPKPIRLISANGNFNYQIVIEPKQGTDSHYGTNLNRAILEQVLIERAIERGATYLPTAVVKDFAFVDDRITGIKCYSPNGYVEYGAKVVIEARGKETPLAHLLGSKKKKEKQDNHVAVFAQFTGSSFTEIIPDDGILVIMLDYGYVLATPLPYEGAYEGVSIMAAIEGQKVNSNGSDSNKIFQEAVNFWKPLAKAIRAAQKITPTLLVMNHNWEYERFSGNGFLVVGDAVAFLDPFSCNGVAIGMNGGKIAADFVAQDIGKDCRLPRAKQTFRYDEEIRALIDKWKQIWGIENLSLSGMCLLRQSLGLLGELQSLKLKRINEEWTQNSPAFAAKN